MCAGIGPCLMLWCMWHQSYRLNGCCKTNQQMFRCHRSVMTLDVWRPLMRRISVKAMAHHCVLFYLLIHALLPQERLATLCPVLGSACLYKNTYAISTKMLSVRERDIFPSSCLSFCAEKEECIGVNENIDSDICEILEDDDIITGLEWIDSQSHDFWSFEEPCPKVWHCVVIIRKLFQYFATVEICSMNLRINTSVKPLSWRWWIRTLDIFIPNHTQWLQQSTLVGTCICGLYVFFLFRSRVSCPEVLDKIVCIPVTTTKSHVMKKRFD